MTKGILVEVELIVLLWGCGTKSLYHGEMEDWHNGIWFKVEIVGKCFKFLISVDSFCEEHYIEYFLYSYVIVTLDFLIE